MPRPTCSIELCRRFNIDMISVFFMPKWLVIGELIWALAAAAAAKRKSSRTISFKTFKTPSDGNHAEMLAQRQKYLSKMNQMYCVRTKYAFVWALRNTYLWPFIALQPCIYQIIHSAATQMIQCVGDFFDVKCWWTDDLIVGCRCRHRLGHCGRRMSWLKYNGHRHLIASDDCEKPAAPRKSAGKNAIFIIGHMAYESIGAGNFTHKCYHFERDRVPHFSEKSHAKRPCRAPIYCPATNRYRWCA